MNNPFIDSNPTCQSLRMSTIKPNRWTLVLMAVAVAVPVWEASAESLECNRQLVQIGDSKFSVLQKCGEPLFKDSFCAPREPNTVNKINGDRRVIIDIAQCRQVDEWSYNPGSGRFITTLQFEGGEVRSMKYGDRAP